jgi:hypothetical protein
MQRRRFLRAFGVAAGAGVATIGSARLVRAASMDERTPEYVTLSYEPDLLERYRPRLVLRNVDRAKFLGLTGLVARSAEHDTTMLVYWTEWSHQEGITDQDSHLGDHEPFYIELDESTDSIQQVIYSAYHWLAARNVSPLTDGNQHPLAYVVSPWHQYSLTSEVGDLMDVDDLTAEFPSWLANGLDESLHPGAVGEPWIMRSRDSWWRRGTFGVSSSEYLWRFGYRFGLAGADQSDTPEIE